MNKQLIKCWHFTLVGMLLPIFVSFSVTAEVLLDFKKCINIGNALDAPNEGDWGVVIEDYFFDDIASAGFDSIRLPVRWDSHFTDGNTIDPKFILRVKYVIDQAISHNLKVIMDVHHFTRLSEDASDENIQMFYDIWTQISESFSSYSDSDLSFELLNEPRGEITSAIWNTMLRQAINIIREDNSTRKIFVGGTTYNTTGSLYFLDLTDIDKTNLVATFHYYLPLDFTHQGYSWVEVAGTFESSDKAYAITRFIAAKKWAMLQQIPLFIGEFGVSRFAETEDRADWLRFMSGMANSINASWCVWSLADGFRFYDVSTRTFDQEILSALGL